MLLAIHGQGGEQNGASFPLPGSRAKTIQNLCVLAAEVERGTVVRSEDPNFILLSRAAQIIQRFLNHMLSGETSSPVEVPVQGGQLNDALPWLPQQDHDLWEFEMGLWQGFAGHPSLMSPIGQL